MKKKTELILITSILLLAFFARLIFWEEGKYGSDFFFHGTIIEQSLEKGELVPRNDLALCYEGVTAGHPKGYYAVYYYVAKIIGAEATFKFLPILLGCIGLLISYGLLRTLFNQRVAMITLFLGAVSLAHASKSYPFSYRGDNIIYPFLMGSLFLLYKCLQENEQRKKWIYAISAGIVSGGSVFFWNGYPLLIIVYIASLLGYIGYRFLKKEEINEDLKFGCVSIIAQSIVFYVLFLTGNYYAKSLVFGEEYYHFLIIGAILLLGTLYLAKKRKSCLPLAVYGTLGIIIAVLVRKKISLIYSGFGSIKADYNAITTSAELFPPSLESLYVIYFITLYTSILGIYFYLRKFDKNKAFFLGLLIPSVYLITSAIRYAYISSIPFLVLTAIFLDNKKIIKKKFEIFTFLTAVICIAMLGWMVFTFPQFLGGNATPKELINAYAFIKENTPKEACIVSIQDKGAMAEYLAKRHYYFNSLGFDEERSRNFYTFLITNETKNFSKKEMYIVLSANDLFFVEKINDQFLHEEDIGIDTSIGMLHNNTLVSTKRESVIHIFEGKKSMKALSVNNEGEIEYIREVFKDGKIYVNSEGKNCLYIQNSNYIYLNDELCDSHFYKMITGQKIKDFEQIYWKDNVVVYRGLN